MHIFLPKKRKLFNYNFPSIISAVSLCNKPNSDSLSPPLNPRTAFIILTPPLFSVFYSVSNAGKQHQQKMKKPPGFITAAFFFLLFLFPAFAFSQSSDAAVMFKLKDSLDPSLGWSAPNPCDWDGVDCNGNKVTRIKISSKGIPGSIPPELSNLASLSILELDDNYLTGPLPNLSGMASITFINVMNNSFTSIPAGFFSGLSSLTKVFLDQNPFEPWTIPDDLKGLTSLNTFSATNATITGSIPDFLFNGDTMTALNNLHLALNRLEGPLPATSIGSFIQSLVLNGQLGESKLSGSITALQNMTSLTEVSLQGNSFTGPIPDFSKSPLQTLNLRDNQMTGIVPASLSKISTLQNLVLTNNLLQGPTPRFDASIKVDMRADSNRFCLDKPEAPCDARINNLLSAVEGMGYPAVLADSWTGNDPCHSWNGIVCSGNDIVMINFKNKGLTGWISPSFSLITSLHQLLLSNNNLTGTIPAELAKMPNLKVLDVSHNNIHGKVPSFNGVTVVTDGNPDIGKDISTPPGSHSPGGSDGKSSASSGKVVGSVIAVVALLVVFVVAGFFLYCRKRKRYTKVQSPSPMVNHPSHSGNQDAIKISVAPTFNGVSNSNGEGGPLVITIQSLQDATDNFSQDNILGRGGFGTVYKGELPDGTKIAVKRMESSVVRESGLSEFTSEIAVLTKVRHRHLVLLIGYCLDGNEKILVYEYMPQGTLSRYLFNWENERLPPLEWTTRLTIALDVARAVEYLHDLAQQSFIHRDLKPSNILLGDDMRAKVADFGLVRLAPDGQNSIATRLAGTFGYMAPEYALTGRVTMKVDVYSFGVILMELISGRRALDERWPGEDRQLVTWFQKRMQIVKIKEAIDPSMEVNEETLASITTVADLACHCTAREPYQRPEMSHVVSTLSTLAELWKPGHRSGQDVDTDEEFESIDFDRPLPQALKNWKLNEGGDV